MISLTTADGEVHASNNWQTALESAVPGKKAGVILGGLISLCLKTTKIDVTMGQAVTDENAPQMLARLHECEIVDMDIMLTP
jgi:hypothetical protein